MGRTKSRPVRAAGAGASADAAAAAAEAGPGAPIPSGGRAKRAPAKVEARRDVRVEAGTSTLGLYNGDRRDVAEVVLRDVTVSGGGEEPLDLQELYRASSYSLRLLVRDAPEVGFRLGNWPVLPSDRVLLECVVNSDHEVNRESSVVLTGCFDGPDDGVSGLAHLVNLRFVTLRVHSLMAFQCMGEVRFKSFTLRVEMMEQAFGACESLLQVVRRPWRKSLMNMMAWLRPEVITSAAIYGTDGLVLPVDGEANASPKSDSQFDLAAFYEAVKPSVDATQLEEELPDLLPRLRPYQLRAANWMVQREKGNTHNQEYAHSAPYCVPIDFIHKNSRMFYNPFNGNVSLQPELSPPNVSGGILADEMGLGKTVELLACIFANRKPPSLEFSVPEKKTEIYQIKRQKLERVECICGAASESSEYTGPWVQCNICDAWQHADCVGYSPKKDIVLYDSSEDKTSKNEKGTMRSGIIRMNKKPKCSIVDTEDNYMCALCLEHTEAAQTNIFSHATLIVCPASILAQWQSEISRHTRPGSLKVCIYEGARNLDSARNYKTDMLEISTADIVLTTYDVFKEDLSHDSDRHDGDHRFLRFQKRYPIIPTVLTRIHWWRLCLDEAQMVESSKTLVTEMAMRLNAQHRWCITGTPIQHRLDDLFGLLRFLRTSPFDTYRWWVDIIRDPYERGNMIAMNYVHKFFRKIMWRSSKVHVSSELQLPLQEECFSWLTFSNIEDYFYKKQHATCMDQAHQIIRSLRNGADRDESASDSSAVLNACLPDNDIAKLPLLKLRQACCHPQVGSSGLCSLQHDPLTMDEILQVLIGKVKKEGEEELRKIVGALNGLAGIAIIEQRHLEAISLYKEALALAHKNINDFRVDPLLNLHVNYNLAELLRTSSECLQECPLKGQQHEYDSRRKRKENSSADSDLRSVKRNKTCMNNILSLTDNGLETSDEEKNVIGQTHTNGDVDAENVGGYHSSFECFSYNCLKKSCNAIKEKYLSVFTARLTVAQKDFSAASTEVLNLTREVQNHMNWWMHSLDRIESSNGSTKELIRKIDNSSANITGSGSSGMSYRVNTIAGLRYAIQIDIDRLQNSRQQLMDRLLEVNKTMDNPRDEDVEGQRYCPKCYSGTGSLCIQCELDELFQIYEAQLFSVSKSNNDFVIDSVEGAQDLQKQKYELNHFFSNKKTNEGSEPGHTNNNPRSARENTQRQVYYRHPSRTETALKVIRNHSKTLLGRQYYVAAKKHLLLFEAMRKEFSQAFVLSAAQNNLLRAHDELKMCITRMKLKEKDDGPSEANMITRENLVSYNIQFTSDKFMAVSSLARIRGQLRYLQGLLQCNKKPLYKHGESSLEAGNAVDMSTSLPVTGQIISDIGHDLCPICHEKFIDQKMVFQCGHFVCCKCCLSMTEQAATPFGKRKNWIMCPTCRQRTDVGNVAFVDEKRSDKAYKATEDLAESTIPIQGSYGTKVEAVTRRILKIISTDATAKVLVFSSWSDVLDVLEHSFAANDIPYVRMKGGRKSQVALSQFKGQISCLNGKKVKGTVLKKRPVQVLLMLIKHGANGLNLLEAQHVILVEPLLNPATEAQAISRVHRVGQDKSTFVHRFIVKETIEESIHKLNRGRSVCSTMIRKSKNFEDKPVLTLGDVEKLFPMAAPDEPPEQASQDHNDSLRSLPPSVAAGLAAERRQFMQQNESGQ